jgi:hypothetical protein
MTRDDGSGIDDLYEVFPATVTDFVEIHCLCGGTVRASKEHASVFHSLPYCRAYFELAPDRFLEALRVAREKGPRA